MQQTLIGWGDKITGVKLDIDEMKKKLTAMEQKQFPFAASLAINRTLSLAKKTIQGRMHSIFDRPAPFTVNSMYIQVSTKKSLYGEIGFRYKAEGGTPASRYLISHVEGGQNLNKPSENLLARRRIIPRGSHLVASDAVKKNQYGNVSPGTYSKILSALQARTEQGSIQNTRNKGKAAKYFAGTPRGGSRPFAIYERLRGKLRPLFMVVQRTQYKARFPIVSMVQVQVDWHLEKQFNRAIELAIKTAKGNKNT